MWFFFLPVLCAAYHSLRAGAERLRGKGPTESRLVRSAGSRGPAGGVMGSVIVPAVWIGQGCGGWVGGVRSPGKKGKGGDTSITCAPSDPSLPLSLYGQAHCLRGGALFYRQLHIPPPLFKTGFTPFPKLQKLNCINLSLMCFSFICHCQKISVFLKKRRAFF